MAIVAAAFSLPSESRITKQQVQLSFDPVQNFKEGGLCYPISYGIACNSIKSLIDDGPRVHDLTSMRCKSPFFGSPCFLWPSMGHYLCLSMICVAADCSASLSSSEIARTTVKANKNALLVFPGMVHYEPHEQISWAEFQYLLDDYGDIYFEIFDDANLLKDRRAYNPVNALIGMDIPMYDNKRNSEDDIFKEFPFPKAPEMEEFNTPVNWGLSDNTSSVHPIYFSKRLAKAVDMEYDKRTNHPSNGVSILGYLRPAYADEESRIRIICNNKYIDGYSSDWKDTNLKLYRLKIEKIKLHSVYGSQSEIGLLEFQDAEPDILVHFTSAILDCFNRNCNNALKGFCKKKGLDAEGAHLIGVDSLGVDVRVISGTEVKTLRFPFKDKATSRNMAEKQILKLLFPRTWQRKYMQSWRRRGSKSSMS